MTDTVPLRLIGNDLELFVKRYNNLAKKIAELEAEYNNLEQKYNDLNNKYSPAGSRYEKGEFLEGGEINLITVLTYMVPVLIDKINTYKRMKEQKEKLERDIEKLNEDISKLEIEKHREEIRKGDIIDEELLRRLEALQHGGGSKNINYYEKYLKYKHKYQNLINKKN